VNTAPLRSAPSAAAHGAAGFSLVEILVAVAILAILSAALSPMVIKFINDGRRARALSDSQALGTAILNFQVDTGLWPVSNDGNTMNAGEVSRLVGLPAASISAANIPDGNGTAGTSGWEGGGNGGTGAAISDQLITNSSTGVATLYATSASPPEPPGWNGPYVRMVPLDPWGHPYVCDVRYLLNANITSVTTAIANDHLVTCLSAGANGLYDTVFADNTSLQTIGGDDIGYLIQGNQTLH
jgi:prepilin-type N-terminal cleavage/methylation domain-containing protein